MKLKRTNYNLTVRQHTQLKASAEEIGIPVSELLRRIIDQWLESHTGLIFTPPPLAIANTKKRKNTINAKN